MAVISTLFDDLGLENPSQTYRLGIMGGTFDPIHIGHLACAEQVHESFGLDGVIFVPAGTPVYKKNKKVTPAADRLAMCQLAVASNPAFDVSAIEIERGGDTYTIDTLRQLKDHYPDNVELYFITGADAVFNIIRWKDSAAIARLAHFIAVTRPGYVISDEQKDYLDQNSNFSISYSEVTALSISSSDLRAKLNKGKSIRYLTMLNVYEYIQEHHLYQKEFQNMGVDCFPEGEL